MILITEITGRNWIQERKEHTRHWVTPGLSALSYPRPCVWGLMRRNESRCLKNKESMDKKKGGKQQRGTTDTADRLINIYARERQAFSLSLQVAEDIYAPAHWDICVSRQGDSYTGRTGMLIYALTAIDRTGVNHCHYIRF